MGTHDFCPDYIDMDEKESVEHYRFPALSAARQRFIGNLFFDCRADLASASVNNLMVSACRKMKGISFLFLFL